MDAPIVAIDEFKYLVVDTGYTARLLDKLDTIKAKIISDCMHDSPDNSPEDKDDDEENETCALCRDPVLYIDDDVWGSGFSPVSESEDEIQHVRDVLSKLGDTSGIIVFRCNSLSAAMGLVDILVQQDYCACFSMTSLQTIKQIGDVLYLEYDAESG